MGTKNQFCKNFTAQVVSCFLAFFFFQQKYLHADSTITILGSEVIPSLQTYIATSSVNIRETASVKSKKIGHFKAGKRIKSLGVTKDGFWIVAESKGKPIGFVYQKVLQIVLDGALDEDLVGNVKLTKNLACGYKIHFVEKSQVEGQNFFMADYDVNFSCAKGKTEIIFPAQMFLAETPNYLEKSSPVFQINLDVLDNYHAANDVFSTIMYFHPKKNEVILGGTSFLDYGKRKNVNKTESANNLEKALRGSLKLALHVWNGRAWSDIIKHSKNRKGDL